MTAPGWAAARKLLCIRLDGMGDVLMTTPAIAAIRRALPDAELTLLASPAGAAIAGLIPDLDHVIEYRAPWMKSEHDAGAAADHALLARLQSERFDAAVIFTVFSQSALPAALLCRLAGIPLVLAHLREQGYHLLSDAVPEPEPDAARRHEVQRQLDLVGAIGCSVPDDRLVLSLPNDATRRVDRLLVDRAVRGAWVLVHPGSTASSRRYPVPLLAEALARIAAGGVAVATVGGEDDRDVLAVLGEACPGLVNLGTGLPLADLVALIDRAPVLISNNSGPMHIAAARGTPVVALYAGTNPQHTPWRVPARTLTHVVDCMPCYRSVCARGDNACLSGVAPAEVAAAALSLLAEGRRVAA